MPIEARRSFRLASCVALALAVSHGLGIALPYLAPLMALFLTAKPGSPIPPGKLLVLLLVLAIALGSGLLLGPLLEAYPPIGLAFLAYGLWASASLSLGTRGAALGTVLAAGLTLVSAFAVLSLAVAQAVIVALLVAVAVAVACQWVVYPFFPEDPVSRPVPEAPVPPDVAGRALRAMLITLPAYLFLLINPMAHTPVMMKSIALSLSVDQAAAKTSARDLLSATLLGGAVALLLWFLLRLAPELGFYAAWMWLAVLMLGTKLYLHARSAQATAYWLDVGVTVIILLGPAVLDGAGGKDPLAGFFVRFGLFLLVAIYAAAAGRAADWVYARRTQARAGYGKRDAIA